MVLCDVLEIDLLSIMAGGNSCSVCKTNVTKVMKPGLECVQCKLLFHFEKCSNITAAEFDHIEKGRLVWKCKKCLASRKSIVFARRDSSSSEITTDQVSDESLDTKSQLDIIKSSQDEIKASVDELRKLIMNIIDKFETVTNSLDHLKEIDTKITNLNNNISNIEKNAIPTTIAQHDEIKSHKIRYSDVIKNPVLIIKPKNTQQNSETTTSQIKQSIEDPSAFNVKGIRTVNNGSVVVSCENEDSIERMRTEISSKLGDDYNVTIPMKRLMQLKIFGLSSSYSKEELAAKIQLQNKTFTTDSKLKVVYMKDNQTGGNAIIETDESTHNALLSIGRLYIGWDSCRVYEYGNVLRCYKCQAFHHTAHNCRNGDRCGRCGENHKSSDCKSEMKKCINCSIFKEQSNLDIQDDHYAWDHNCSVYKHKTEVERKRLDYLK